MRALVPGVVIIASDRQLFAVSKLFLCALFVANITHPFTLATKNANRIRFRLSGKGFSLYKITSI
jgi:hypothetical protein